MLLTQDQYKDLKSKGISDRTIAQTLVERGGFKTLDNTEQYTNDMFAEINQRIINLDINDLEPQHREAIQAPVEETEEQKRQYRLQKQREYNTEFMGLGQRGVRQGLNTVHASYGAIAALVGNIAEKAGLSKAGQYLQEQGMNTYREQMEDASLYQTPQAKDITGGISALKYVYGLAATQLPVIMSVLASGGTAGGLTAIVARKAGSKIAKRQLIAKVGKAGGLTAIGQLESGLNYGELLAEHGVKAPYSSLAFGALSAYIETLGGNFGVVDDFIKGIAAGAKGSTIKRLGANLAKNVPAEAGQESFQEVNSILNVVMNTDEKFLTKENMGKIMESGFAGATMGVPGGIVETVRPTPVDDSDTKTTEKDLDVDYLDIEDLETEGLETEDLETEDLETEDLDIDPEVTIQVRSEENKHVVKDIKMPASRIQSSINEQRQILAKIMECMSS